VTITNASFAPNMSFPNSLSAGTTMTFIYLAVTSLWYVK
jgi:hypothetical protein